MVFSKGTIQKRLSKILYPLKVEKGSQSQKSMLFLLPVQLYPAGGAIVAHYHSVVISQLQYKEFKSEVLYSENVFYRTKLFADQAALRCDNKLDPDKDFVLVPEILAQRYGKIFGQLGIKYGIHVQNGYSIGVEVRVGNASFQQLKDAYENASLIIGNSVDTIENIKTIFPDISKEIVRSYFVINKARHQPIENKKNIITYMPRKLSKHSQLVLIFLGDKLPSNWTIKSIHGVTEQEVYDIFYESKIFLSFSEFEGLAMPPAMAAMSGNRVIGYTGEANKEYFHLSCFEEVHCGDIKDFVAKILAAVERFDNGLETIDEQAIAELKTLFSEEKQQQFIRQLVDRVDEIL
ncbi:MAG: glycosyltransferase [Methylophaga sp.]|nr:glycosyltransferase [Methylophaga sp.]